MIATARHAWVLDPSTAVLQGYSAAILAMLERVPDAIETCARTGESRESCARTYSALTDPSQRARALHLLAFPDSAPRTSMLRIRTFRAAVYAHLGDRDAAFALLDNVFRTGRESGLFALINSPWIQPLRSDSRWQTIVEARR